MLEFDKKYTSYTEMLDGLPRETIGSVGGVPLTIPAEVPASVPMAYNRMRLNRGDDMAITWALELMLTPDGFGSLIEADVDEQGWATIVDIVISRVRGASVGVADAAPKALTNGAPTTQKPAASRRRPAAKKP